MFKLEGFDKLRKELDRRARRIQRNLMPKFVEEAADQVVAEVRKRAPVESGDLREHVHAERVVIRKAVSVLIVIPSGHADDKMLPIHLEYGTATKPAKPFVRPAWRSVKKRIKKDFYVMVKREMSK